MPEIPGDSDGIPGYRDYLRGWRQVHGLEPDRLAGGFVERYLRLPYVLARPLARRRVAPNALTLAGLLLATASLLPYLAGGRVMALAAPLVVAAGLSDQVDGAVAVLSRRTTAFGAVWDSVADRLSDVALLVGPAVLLVRHDRSDGVVGVVLFGITLFLLEYVRARTQAVHHVTQQIVTPAERPTRVVFCAVLPLVALVSDDAGVATAWAAAAWALAALTAVSAAVLLRDAARRGSRVGLPTTPTTPPSA